MTVTRVFRRGQKRPQVVWTDDHRLRTIGRQAEAQTGLLGGLGPVITPATTLRDALGMFGSSGGALFFTDGVWHVTSSVLCSINKIAIIGSSKNTVFKRSSSASGSDAMLEFQGDDVVIDSITFVDELAGSPGAVHCTGERSIIQRCVFSSVQAGVVMGAQDCIVRDCFFEEVKDTAVEYNQTVSGGLVTGNRFVPSTDADPDVLFGDNVSKSGIFTNNFSSGGKISYKTGQDIVGDQTTNVIDAADITVRP